MPVLLGILVGDAFGRGMARVVLSHAFLTMLVWCAAVWVGIRIGYYNIGPSAGYVIGALFPALLLVWILWRPTRSRAKIWMLDGLFVWARIGLIVTAGWTLMVLAATDWKLWASFPRLWPSATACVGLWVGQRALIGVLRHSHRRDADASLVMDRQ